MVLRCPNAKVKEAVHIETGMRYAAKIIKKTAIKTKKDADTVKKEVTQLSKGFLGSESQL